MALTRTWEERAAYHGDLVKAYVAVGGVEGALAQAAEQVHQQTLHRHAHQQFASELDVVLLRLVRLGDTGGATRRIANRQEFDDTGWRLIQFLASDEGKRLALVGGETDAATTELAHEALVTAWPHYQYLLQSVSGEKRVLDDLIPKAKRWADAEVAERAAQLASGAELAQFSRLASDRPRWLSRTEIEFVAASRELERHQQRRDRRLSQLTRVSVVVLFLGLGGMTWLYLATQRALEHATVPRRPLCGIVSISRARPPRS